MSAQISCPRGCRVPLSSRVNPQTGMAYLECGDCRFVEPITRKPDPHPTIVRVHTNKYGHVRVSRRGGAQP